MSQRHLLVCLLLATACGDDSTNKPIDAGQDVVVNACSTASMTIASFPGMVDGTVLGGGKDLTAPEMGCTEEHDWYDPKGEDTVIALSGLTVGMRYGIKMDAKDDLSMYVTTSCPAAGPVTGCVLFADTGVGGDGETGSFIATTTEAYLVIDNAEFDPLTDGAFHVEVVPAQCSADTEATDCTAATPFCVDFGCVQCVSPFNCTAGTPVCNADSTCVAGPMTCTGDDARDAGAGDDGPSVATMIANPTTGTPTTIMGNVCNTPDRISESDWFKVMLTDDVVVSLSFTGATNDLDFYVLDSMGQTVASGDTEGAVNETALTEGVTPGLYYILVLQYAPASTVAAVPYTLSVRVPECDPSVFLQCAANGTNTVCNAGVCSPGPADCLLDTAGEPADDGPAGARTLTTAPLSGSVCSQPDTEKDFYKFTVTNGQGYVINLAWTGTDDLDLYVMDGSGKPYGQSFYKNPETVTLTNLAAGTYYARVENFNMTPSTTSQAYTITGTATAVVPCTNATSCATTYSTQFFRGSCNATTDVCSFLPAGTGANNTLCDSGSNCVSKRCSYLPFESDAQDSVCIPTGCTMDAECQAISNQLKCTTGFTNFLSQPANFCEPLCTTNLECGARVSSMTLDVGQPWDYNTCTVATGVCGTP